MTEKATSLAMLMINPRVVSLLRIVSSRDRDDSAGPLFAA